MAFSGCVEVWCWSQGWLEDADGRAFLLGCQGLVLSSTKMGICSFGIEIFVDLMSLVALVLGHFVLQI